ncbi:hypothetical protein CHS0354_038777 [Potamilus streckersoni]|uniref:CARD domain-containing protein n=1 Tax=Potamilus streckersoni TaxID=2493646 RepID=A0AAE0W0C0_9BIVA|nr:hypothetical protein CHS0354_038777 [Potamilus streckersoni]
MQFDDCKYDHHIVINIAVTVVPAESHPSKEGEVMDTEDKKSLCTRRVALVEDLEPQKVLGYLIEDGILTENDVELISNGKTRKERCHLLLSMLPKRGPSAYGSFQRALRATNMYPHLDTLLRTNRQHYTKTSVGISCLQGATGVEAADYEDDVVETAGNIQKVESIMVMTARCHKDHGESHVKNVEKGRYVCYKCKPFVPRYGKKSQVS